MHYAIRDDQDGTADGLLTYHNGLGGYTMIEDPDGLNGTVNGNRMDRVYNVSGISSASGVYRLGILKDNYLTAAYGKRIGLLLVDSTTPFDYDTVYADLNDDFDFTDETPATAASPILTRDLNGDGLADISGGNLYFILHEGAAVSHRLVPPVWGPEKGGTRAKPAPGDPVG